MLLDGTRQYNLFQIPSFLDQIAHRIAVGDACHVLFDDGSGIQVGGDIMAGGSDQLHAAFVGLMIGLCSDERRQKTLADIDDAVRIPGHELLRQYLHVARQNYEIYAVEYVLGSSLTVEGGRITGENAQFSDNLLPGEKITVEAEIPYGKWFYKWEITEYPWGDDVEAEEGYIPQSAVIDSLYSAKAVITMGDKDVSVKAIYMDQSSHGDSDRHERQSSTGIRARRDGRWSLDPDGTWSYRVGTEKATGWQYAYYSGGPAWFSFNEKGQMETGWKQDKTYWY